MSESNGRRYIGIYARVSTRRQDTRSQEPDLKRWLEAYADGIPVKWFRDKASGKSMDRPGWNRLETAIDSGHVEKLVCWRLDRLGRTASGLTALFEKLQDRRVTLVSIRDGLDLGTPAGRMMANVLASVAAYEVEVKSERILAGQSAARAAGKTWGGSKKGRRLKVTDEQIATITRMHADGGSKSAMARATGLSRPSVYAVLNGGW